MSIQAQPEGELEAEDSFHLNAERVFEVLAGGGVGLCLVDPELRYCWVNQALADLLGCEQSDLVGRPFLDLTHPDDADLDVYLSEQLFRGEIPYFTVRKRLIRSDGSVMVADLLATASPTDGEVEYGIGVITDAELADPTTQRIEALQRSAIVGQVTAAVAHELRNSLASISLAQAAIASGNSDQKAAQSLLRGELDVSQHLLGSLAAFTQPPATAQSRRTERVALACDVLEQMRPFLSLVIPAGVTLTLGTRFADVAARINPRELQQILVNLVLNARDAIPTNRGEISVYLAIPLDSPGFVDVVVEDNGEGMSKETQRQIFEPYFTTKGDAGTGLGLPICRDVAERNGGQLLVRSELGRGTAVTVRLPVIS